MSITDATHAYVGTGACGCTLAVVVDHPNQLRETAKAVYEFIVDGLQVTRMAIDDVRGLFRQCPHQTTTTPSAETSLYEVHLFGLAYILAGNEETAEAMIRDVLIEPLLDVNGPMDLYVQRATTVDDASRHTIPWGEADETRTCQEIIDEAHLNARQIAIEFTP